MTVFDEVENGCGHRRSPCRGVRDVGRSGLAGSAVRNGLELRVRAHRSISKRAARGRRGKSEEEPKAARDHGCAYPGCGRPPSWSEVHHIQPWEQGGETALHNCVMLCKVHHRLLHHSQWLVRLRDGLPEFIPPAWIDPERKPRRRPLPHLAA